MAVTTERRQPGRTEPPSALAPARLGIDQPSGWWPAVPRLKSYEAAGFAHLQVRLPAELLADQAQVSAHAGALAERLGSTGLRLVLHAPGELIAGSAERDAQLDGALRYAAIAGAELLVPHGAGAA